MPRDAQGAQPRRADGNVGRDLGLVRGFLFAFFLSCGGVWDVQGRFQGAFLGRGWVLFRYLDGRGLRSPSQRLYSLFLFASETARTSTKREARTVTCSTRVEFVFLHVNVSATHVRRGEASSVSVLVVFLFRASARWLEQYCSLKVTPLVRRNVSYPL